MANRKFEMYEYRQISLRMRLGETDRALSKAGLMGGRKPGEIRRLAESSSWLDPTRPLPARCARGRPVQGIRSGNRGMNPSRLGI